MGIGHPYQTDVVFRRESAYGSGITGPIMIVSDKIFNVRIDSGDMKKPIRGISEPSVSAFISQASNPILHLEWVLQSQTSVSLATYCCNRNSYGDLQSLWFEVGMNTKGTTQSWYRLGGCKCKRFELAGSFNNEYVCTADFSVKSVATASTASSTISAAVGNPYAYFNHSGNTITITGKTTPAFITDSINIVVEHNLTDKWDCDSRAKVAAISGALDITGSCDISLDDGGAVHWGDVFGGKLITSIAIVTGCAGLDDTFTLNTGYFDNTSIDASLANEGQMVSQPFRFKSLTIS